MNLKGFESVTKTFSKPFALQSLEFPNGKTTS